MVHSWGPIVGTITTIYENVRLSVWDIDILPGTSGNWQMNWDIFFFFILEFGNVKV